MSEDFRPCPRCFPGGLKLRVWTDRDGTSIQCRECGCTMSKLSWQEPRPLELEWMRRFRELQVALRKERKERRRLEAESPKQLVDPAKALDVRLSSMERRIRTLESCGQILGPSPSNPIPGAWPYVPAPVCATCCGPHRTGECVR